MTRPIFEPSLSRTDAKLGFGSNQLFRRPAPLTAAGQYPIVFRAAISCIEDPEANALHYASGDGPDNVWWNQWDTTFDSAIYDTGPWEFTDPFTGDPSISGVTLKAIGLYSIFALIDISAYLNGITYLCSNFDGDGQVVYLEHNMDPDSPFDQFLGDSMGIRLDQWREVVFTPEDDGYWGGSQNDVEITFAQNNNATINYYGDSPGTVPLASPSDPPTPGEDLWIPGGQTGAWGMTPRLVVMYWGNTLGDPDWPTSFPTLCDS